MKKYITTAIVYPNSRIHVGWAWECLGADWLARSYRLFGTESVLVTGMDEHSLNVQKKAEELGLSPKIYCDQMSEDIQGVLKQMGMKYDRFIRTSDEDHHRVVTHLIQKCFDKGDIYRAKYEGHYCESCEAYYTEKDLVEGLCPQHKKSTKWISEENFFFRLSKYEKPLLKFFEDNPDFLLPEHRAAEVLNVIKAGLKDFSISRANFTWGIPIPFKPEEVIYVWFDALINYLTAVGIESEWDKKAKVDFKFNELWPNVLHIIGKDISRFHCIYWPAMLMSLEIAPPKNVFAHGFIQLKGEKMSKSLGTMVAPDEVMNQTGADPFRYYLLAENSFSKDGNFSIEALVEKSNADLANEWGNLVNRSISMTRKYFPDTALKATSQFSHSKKIREGFETWRDGLWKAVGDVDPSGYAILCKAQARALNLYLDETKPWKLAKEMEKNGAELSESLFTVLEGIRWLATGMHSLLPFKMPEVLQQLNVQAAEELGAVKKLKWGEVSFKPGAPSPLYPRIELKPET